MLRLMVIIGALALLISHWNRTEMTRIDGPQRHLGQRNENSIPRSFILPATPAVALEQERQIKAKDGEDLKTDECMGSLLLNPDAKPVPRTRGMYKCE